MKRRKWHKVPHEVNPEWGLNHYDLQTLATYNAECGRGIIHTIEWTLVLDPKYLLGWENRLAALALSVLRWVDKRAEDRAWGPKWTWDDEARRYVPVSALPGSEEKEGNE